MTPLQANAALDNSGISAATANTEDGLPEDAAMAVLKVLAKCCDVSNETQMASLLQNGLLECLVRGISNLKI